MKPSVITIIITTMIVVIAILLLVAIKTRPSVKDHKLECLTVYSGGKQISDFRGHRPPSTSSDGRLQFVDERLGTIYIRADWILVPCQ